MPAAFVGAAAAAVTAGTQIASAVEGSGSQSSAVSSGAASANASQQAALQDYTNNEQPFITTGQNALSGLGDATGLNGTTGTANALSNFTASPGYQYDLSQALSAVDNGAASNGTLRGGNTIRAEENVGSQLANQDFGQYVNRLSGLATQGQTATAGLGSAEVSTGAGVASTDASAATQQSAISGNTAKGVGSAIAGLAGNSSVQNALSGIGSTTQVATPTAASYNSLSASDFSLGSF